MPTKKNKEPLSKTHPELANEADGWDPSVVSAGTHKKFSWKCNWGHTWLSSPNSRTHLNKPTGCPYCSGKSVWPGFNDLKTSHPKVAILADNWDPSSVSAGSGKKLNWICKKGHSWKASPHDQIKSEGRCPFCDGYRTWPGFNDLQTTNPELAQEITEADPSEIRVGSNKKYVWRCSFGHEWKTSPAERSKGKGCPYCSGSKVWPGFNDLETTHPELATEVRGTSPKSISKGSNTPIAWECKFRHTWRSSPNQRTSGYGCPYCSGRSVWKGFNDLATTHPHLSLELLDVDPTVINQGSTKRAKWKCAQGHIWSATPNNRTANQSGCPSCTKSGFDPNQDGYLYLLLHPAWEMYQIGITNFPAQRLASHRKLGWEVMELRGPTEGDLARDWETSILRMLRRNGASLGVVGAQGRFDGYTEAWTMDSFPVKNLQVLMRLSEEEESRFKS